MLHMFSRTNYMQRRNIRTLHTSALSHIEPIILIINKCVGLRSTHVRKKLYGDRIKNDMNLIEHSTQLRRFS